MHIFPIALFITTILEVGRINGNKREQDFDECVLGGLVYLLQQNW
jgi:hypothetical protein